MYAVVEFCLKNSVSNEIAIVPLSWFKKGEKRCYWPTKIKGTLTTFIKELNPPERQWAHYPIYKIHLKTESYEMAEEAITQLIQESELSASCSGTGTGSIIRRTIINHASSSSSDEDEMPYKKKRLANPLANDPIDAANKENRNETNYVTHLHEVMNSPAPSSTSTITNSTRSEVIELNNPSDFESTMLSTMAGLQTTSNQILLTMQEILRINKQISLEKLVSPENIPTFPLKSPEEFDKFEKLIEDDHMVNQYMVRRLAALGGSGVEGVTRRIMKFLMTNEVGLRFNWKGRYNKIAFESTKIMSVIYEAAKLNFPVHEKNDKNISFAVKEWLKHSSTRIAQARQSQDRKKINN